MTDPLRVLLVEDNPDDERLLLRELRKGGLAVQTERVDTREGVRAALARGGWHLVIADYVVPGFSGLDALAEVRAARPDLPFILVSGAVGEETAVESIKAGADDYLLKQNLIRLVPAVTRAIREAGERRRRVAAEQDLRESRERLALIYNAVSDCLVFMTRTPAGRWVYASVNRAFVAKLAELGLPADPAGLLGRDAEAVEREQFGLDPDTIGWLADRRQEAAAHGRLVRAEREFRLPPGVVIGEVTLIPVVDPAGATRHLLIDGRDVTAQRRAEEQERRTREQAAQAQKMEALGTLSGGIAHDFNNLLTAILGFTDLAVGAANLTEAREHAAQIRAAAVRAAGLVGRILAFSRRQPSVRELVSVTDVVREVLPLVAAAFPKSVFLDAHTPAPGPRVQADPGQLLQVVLNLCTNAAQAMPRGGRLTVAVEEVGLDAAFCAVHHPLAPGRHAKLSVTDTGTGMSAEVLRRVFEPFFTTKPRGQGTGLGLSVVHGIVADHGWAVTVTSALGEGTTFDVYMSVAAAVPAPSVAPLTAAAGRGERVLCLDDDPVLADLTGHMLADLNYRPVAFSDPERALAAFAEAPGGFDAILADVQMPKLSGPEVAAAARRIWSAVPVVLMTGSADEVPAGTTVLAKPFTREQLAAALGRAFRRHE